MLHGAPPPILCSAQAPPWGAFGHSGQDTTWPGAGLRAPEKPESLGVGWDGTWDQGLAANLPALDWAAARLLWLRTGRAQGAHSGTSLLGGCCGLAPPVWSANCTCGWEEINPLQLPLWRRFLIQGWPSPPGLGTPSPPLLVTELVSVYPISASEPRVWSPHIRACCPSNGVTCF